jgi:hypothetical protein
MWAKPAGVMLPISVMVRAGDRCKARFAAKARRPRLPRPFWRALSGLDFAAVSVSVPALASAFISRTRQKIESMSGPSRWAAANCPAQSDHFSSAMRWLGHHRLRDRKLLGRFHRVAGAHNGEQDLQLQFVSVVDGQPRFLRMHFPFFVTPLDLPCQPMHPISFLVELGELKSASEKASGRLIVSGPPLNSGSALRSAALSWLIGAAALA